MPQTRFAADAFGVVTIILFVLFVILSLLCIFQCVYFHLCIRRGGNLQLGYFNGPWITRIALILLSIWWGLGEVFRLDLVKRRLFSSLTWQRNVCKVYIVSSLGFAEPSIFLTLAFLLHASLQKRESGSLNQRWNKKTIGCIFLFCIPVVIMQALLVIIGPKFVNEENSDGRTKMSKYFAQTSFVHGDHNVCTYPLFGTILLGLFDTLMISYVSYIGSRILSSVINKKLRRRVYWLISSVVFFLPVRVLLLGFSVLPYPGDLAYETIIFLSFLTMLSCMAVGIVMLVYYPVTDSLALALRDLGHGEMTEMTPYDDYYYFETASLMTNQSHHDIERNSDTSTKRGSISFRTMIRDDPPTSDGVGETSFSSHGALHIGSPSGSSPSAARPMLPLREVPRY
ncbi:uncharacterized protein [Typha latifolia]|uniref:uncharacterized protein n=1 Tax=Typha latifolia TaxID=4733 RepID=UPI003C305E3E